LYKRAGLLSVLSSWYVEPNALTDFSYFKIEYLDQRINHTKNGKIRTTTRATIAKEDDNLSLLVIQTIYIISANFKQLTSLTLSMEEMAYSI
jgi:hypothetical protein